MPARRPPGADVLRLRAQRRRRASELLDLAEKAVPQSARSQPAAVRQGQRRRGAADRARRPIRRPTSSPMSSRSSTIPSSASSACSASTRARCARTRSCSSTTARSRSRSATCSSSRARTTSRSTQADPRRHRRGGQDRRTPFRCRAARLATTRTRSTSRRWSFPSRCSASPSRRRTRGQEQKLATALHKLAEEDPGFRVEHNTELNETVMRGLVGPAPAGDARAAEGTLRRRGQDAAAAHRLSRNHQRQGRRPPPAQEADRRRRPVRRGVPARSSRSSAARGFEFVDEVKGGTIPGQFMPAVEKGVRQVLHGGAVAGYPLQDVRVIVYDGKYHAVDSQGSRLRRRRQEGLPRRDRQGATRRCWSRSSTWRSPRPSSTWATSAAAWPSSARASTAPIRCAAARSWSRRRCRCRNWTATRRNSSRSTAGRGRYALDFSHYEPVPPQVQQKLVEAYKPRHDEE